MLSRTRLSFAGLSLRGLSLPGLTRRGGRSAPSAPARPRFDLQLGTVLDGIGDRDLAATAGLRRDTAGSWLIGLLVAFTVLLVAALWLVSFAKQESMRGYVTAAGATRLTSAFQGTVSRVWVRQGEAVAAGQKLVTIRQAQAVTDGRSTTGATIETLKAQRDNIAGEILRLTDIIDHDSADRAVFEADQAALKRTLEAQAATLDSSLAETETLVERTRRLLKQGYATRETLLNLQRTAMDYSRQLGELRMRLTELSSSLVDRRRQLDAAVTDATARRSQYRNDLAAIDARLVEAAAQGDVEIVAPRAGQVATLPLREGMAVQAGQFAVGLADAGAPLLINLEAQSKSIGLLKPGDRVVLKYDAFPYKTFGVQYGHVRSVSDNALNLPASLIPSAATLPGMREPPPPPQSSFLVEVVPEKTAIDAYGERRPLLIGSSLTADVIVERRRLIEWVLDPILAMQGRL